MTGCYQGPRYGCWTLIENETRFLSLSIVTSIQGWLGQTLSPSHRELRQKDPVEFKERSQGLFIVSVSERDVAGPKLHSRL